jgi:predicted RNA-binding Zn ribbon-like protein
MVTYELRAEQGRLAPMTWAAADLVAELDRTDRTVRRAPAPLDLAQALVNTLNRVRGYDLLADVPTARTWLGRVTPDLERERLGQEDLVQLVRLREALRGLLRSTTRGEPVEPATLAVLSESSRRHPVVVSVDSAGVPGIEPAAIAPDRPADALAARVLAALPAAAAAGTLPRLKVCANPDCEWSFYDTSRSRSGNWCVMNICGARHKMARYRDRQRSADPASG